MKREKKCLNCGKKFTYTISRGKDRKHCAKTCANEYATKQYRLKDKGQCITDGCTNDISRATYKLCESCYYRLRRNGSTGKRDPAYRYVRSDNYVVLYKPNHPIADKNGNVNEHRYVMYEHVGKGKHNCFWCGVQLTWNSIVVDHLNENRSDNCISNLVISCNACNRARGAMLPFIRRMRPQAKKKLIDIML